MTGYTEQGTVTTDSGTYGGDIQVGVAWHRRFAKDNGDGTFTLITEYAYPVILDNDQHERFERGEVNCEGKELRAADDAIIFDVQNQTEFMVCTDLEDPGSTEVTCDYEYGYVNDLAFYTVEGASAYAYGFITGLDPAYYI